MQDSGEDLMAREIRRVSKSLLEARKVDYVIGFEEDGEGAVCPVFVEHPEDVDKLVWNDKCVYNLAVFLKKAFKNGGAGVAVVSKGCDVRSIIALMQEEQIVRERLTIIGVDCSGQRDDQGDLLLKCNHCKDHRPRLYDHLVVDRRVDVRMFDVEENHYPDVEEMEKMGIEERLKFWRGEAEKCIRCYACREVCLLCYCVECFTDQNLPQYVPPSPSIKGNFLWLLMRAYDLAGRCTGCMECDRVCPMDIPLHLLNLKVAKDVAELFGYEAGGDPDEKPPLTMFSEEDPDEFIL